MGKKAKDHRKKVAKRNESMKLQQKKMQMSQQDYLMEMIQKEKAAGAFNSPVTRQEDIIGAPLPTLTEQGYII